MIKQLRARRPAQQSQPPRAKPSTAGGRRWSVVVSSVCFVVVIAAGVNFVNVVLLSKNVHDGSKFLLSGHRSVYCYGYSLCACVFLSQN